MKKLEFSARDFSLLNKNSSFLAANIAQEIFEKWYAENIESAPTMMLTKFREDYHEWRDYTGSGSTIQNDEKTHTAKLVCIEEIKK